MPAEFIVDQRLKRNLMVTGWSSWKIWLAVGIFVCQLGFTSVFSMAQSAASANSQRIETVLNLLPADTVALKVINGSISVNPDAQPLSEIFDRPGLTLQYWALFPLSNLRFFKQQLNQRLELCVSCLTAAKSNSWDCFSEGWLDLAANPTCKFFFLRPDAKGDQEIRDSIFETNSTYVDSGHPVRELPVSFGSRPEELSTLFLCMPRPNLLVWTNDKTLMHTIIMRLDDAKITRIALPRTLAEWEVVDWQSAYWGFRHFETEADAFAACNVSDASPAFGREPVGVVFDYDLEEGALNIRYLSQNPRIATAVRKLLRLDSKYYDRWQRKHARIKQLSRNSVKITLYDEPPQMKNAAMCMLDRIFGHTLNGH